MQLHTIQSKNRGRRARRIGRGGKRGTYSGRGMKGQKARGKNKIRPEIRDLIKRTPKLRGEEFPMLPKKERPIILQIGELGKKFLSGASVTPKSLKDAGLLPSAKHSAKLLGGGSLDLKLFVRGIQASKSAREKVEKAGGTVES